VACSGGHAAAQGAQATAPAAPPQGWRRPLLVALGLRCQVLPSVPMGDHDCRVDVLVTADGATACTDEGRARWA